MQNWDLRKGNATGIIISNLSCKISLHRNWYLIEIMLKRNPAGLTALQRLSENISGWNWWVRESGHAQNWTMQGWGDARTHLELEWKWTFFSLGLLCAAHTLAFAHTTLHGKYFSDEEAGVKNSYETDELNSLVVVNITKYSPIFKVLPVTIKKNFPFDTGVLKWRSRFLNVSPVPTHFQSLNGIKRFFRFGIY